MILESNCEWEVRGLGRCWGHWSCSGFCGPRLGSRGADPPWDWGHQCGVGGVGACAMLLVMAEYRRGNPRGWGECWLNQINVHYYILRENQIPQCKTIYQIKLVKSNLRCQLSLHTSLQRLPSIISPHSRTRGLRSHREARYSKQNKHLFITRYQ